MPSSLQFHVFLSAVSSEFRNERVQLENWLERKGLHVSSQEKFNQGDSTLWQKLHGEVARCQAVICVIGAEPGWSAGGELPEGGTGTILDPMGVLAGLGRDAMVSTASGQGLRILSF